MQVKSTCVIFLFINIDSTFKASIIYVVDNQGMTFLLLLFIPKTVYDENHSPL